MSNWHAFNDGRSIGTKTLEGDLILFDEENADGARITLKRGDGYLSISLNIYGWMDHSRFFNTDLDAQREYREMRSALTRLLKIIYSPDVNRIRVWESISDFVKRFP